MISTLSILFEAFVQLRTDITFMLYFPAMPNLNSNLFSKPRALLPRKHQTLWFSEYKTFHTPKVFGIIYRLLAMLRCLLATLWWRNISFSSLRELDLMQMEYHEGIGNTNKKTFTEMFGIRWLETGNET